tara:strand:- start:7390 stop:8844 length:1455 start_codon:yes stop_codon:yes gene_type:complete
MNKLIWFRYDLRISGNSAFQEAIKNGNVLPIFIFDEELFKLETSSSFHLKFIKDSLNDLSGKLRKEFNVNLSIYYGNTKEILKFLVHKYSITEIYSNRIFKNKYLTKLDIECENLFNILKVKWFLTNQFGIDLNHRERSKWSYNWNKFIQTDDSYDKFNCKFIKIENKFDFDDVKTNNINGNLIQPGGRDEAIKLLNSFIEVRSENYQREMSSPISGEIACSRLSPHITYGTISLKEIHRKIANKLKKVCTISKRKSLVAFKSRLAWHCHFIQKLYDEPEIEYKNLNSAFDVLRKDFNETYFEAWKKGLTGYPFVDACMRYLEKNGWINFRMRAMLVSFSSYQLWLDWKKTSKHLAKLFTDYEPGIHYSQFQMQSGTTGINSIRIYNPIKQSLDQDPKGDFIKKWVPELKNIQGKLIHEPWKLTYIDQKSINFDLGKDYPLPIVNNQETTRLARDKIWKVKKSDQARELSKLIVKKHASLSSRR